MLKQRHQLFVALLGAVDGLVAGLACYGAWLIRRQMIDGSIPSPEGAGVVAWMREPLALFAVPIVLVAMRLFGLYRPRRDGRVLSEFAQVVKASLLTIVVLIATVFAFAPREFVGWNPGPSSGPLMLEAGRVQLGLLALVLPAMLIAERGFFRLGLRYIRRHGLNLRHVAIIGTGRLAKVTARTLERNSWTGIHVAYFISHQEKNLGPAQVLGKPVLGGMDDLEAILDRRPPDAVYIALPTGKAGLTRALLSRLDRFPVSVRLIPDVNPRYMPQSMVVSELDGMPILSVRESPMEGVSGILKRAIDIAGSLAGLVVFSPVLLLVSLLVRLSGPGPVIFRQRRVSLGGEEFEILKFRTMFHERDEQPPAAWTSRDDPRVTPVGRWLRRTSLDELPQLFNVLAGEMSLVGPRPERPELIARFREDWRGYMLRQHVKAGITGWAQVNGMRGDTDLRKRLQLDLFYIRHWSLGFDIKILWLTLFRGFVHPNAH
ncbi:MAG: undecaprenyl-phosphate glucose phosphotransferase [Tepidisphaera sp.]|nr:undecaprenyl-phosphate glucose phosphotransferase [Tepidisphaera sp.]